MGQQYFYFVSPENRVEIRGMGTRLGGFSLLFPGAAQKNILAEHGVPYTFFLHFIYACLIKMVVLHCILIFMVLLLILFPWT